MPARGDISLLTSLQSDVIVIYSLQMKMDGSAEKLGLIDEVDSDVLDVVNTPVSLVVRKTVSSRRNVVLDSTKIRAAIALDKPVMPKKPVYPGTARNKGKMKSFRLAVEQYWKDMAVYEAAMNTYENDLAFTDAVRPKTRGDCEGGIRPCPHVGCSHNLYLHVNPDNGHITMNFPELEPDEMDPNSSCALDVAECDGLTLEEVGKTLNLTRDAVRQIETLSIGKLREEMNI